MNYYTLEYQHGLGFVAVNKLVISAARVISIFHTCANTYGGASTIQPIQPRVSCNTLTIEDITNTVNALAL